MKKLMLLTAICVIQIAHVYPSIQELNYIVHANDLSPLALQKYVESLTPKNNDTSIQLLQDEVENLRKSINNMSGSSKIQLEKTNRLIKTLLDNHQREQIELLDNFKRTIEDLVTDALLVRQQLLDKEKHKVDQFVDKRDKNVKIEIIQDIRSYDFRNAYDKLQTLGNDQINELINQLYGGNRDDNFNLMLNFALSIDSSRYSFTLLKNLYDAVTKNGGNIESYVKLVEAIKRKTDRTSLQQEATEYVNDIGNSLLNSTKVILAQKLFYDCNRMNKPSNTVNQVFDLNVKLFTQAITVTVKEAYGKVDTKQLIDRIDNYLRMDQKVFGYSVLYDLMKTNGHLNTQTTFKLALALKKLTNDLIDQSGTDQIGYLDEIKRKLPKCVRNAVFSKSVCIKSKHFFNEPLYAAASGFNYDEQRRRVFTWIPRSTDNSKQDNWIMTPTKNGAFTIKNRAYNEYLYPAEGFNIDSERRRVFTWVDPTNSTNGFNGEEQWILEPFGEDCFIKSVKLDEYLFPLDGNKYDNDRRRVCTWIPKGCDAQCLWNLDDCSV